jgi:hypothetical protein
MYQTVVAPVPATVLYRDCLSRIIRQGIQGLLSHVKAVVAPVPANSFLKRLSLENY